MKFGMKFEMKPENVAQSEKLRIQYPIEQVAKPILYHLILDFGLIPNILRARVEHETGGQIDVELTGKEDNLERGKKWMLDQGVTTTPI